MKSFTTKRPTALAACLLALITTLPALAKEPTASFVESAGARARFDQARTYVRPEYLPTVSANANAAPSAAELASKLSAVAVAPDGRTFAANLSAAEIDLFVKAVKRHSGGSSGLHTGDFGEAVPLEGAGTGTVGAESVIGTDQRVRVTNTTTFPFNAIGRIAIGCTGTLIGPRHVLTAGHCVYNTTNNSWYSQLQFTPGQNGAATPYGTIGWSRAISVLGWTRDHNRDYDYAMIVLNDPVGYQTGWLGYGYDNSLPNYNVNINGYPGDKPFGTMWHSYCGLSQIQTYRLYYPCDTAGGMSGSAVYVYLSQANQRTIYGIHAYGVDSTGLNGATRINASVFNNLVAWKSANP